MNPVTVVASASDPSDCMVTWELNSRCNFDCQYCFCSRDVRSQDKPPDAAVSAQQIGEAFDRTGVSWHIHISGGEPFLYPDFVGVAARLTRNHWISINTNLSTSNIDRFWEEVPRERVLLINAAYHVVERECREGACEHFVRRVVELQRRGFPVRVEYVAYPPLFERLERDLAFLMDGGVTQVNFKTFRGYWRSRHYPEAYSAKEKETLARLSSDRREETLIASRASYFGCNCFAGCRLFSMDMHGVMRRCSTSFRTYGNLFNDSFVPARAPEPCPFPACNCPYEGLAFATQKQAGLVALARSCLTDIVPTGRCRLKLCRGVGFLRRRLRR